MNKASFKRVKSMNSTWFKFVIALLLSFKAYAMAEDKINTCEQNCLSCQIVLDEFELERLEDLFNTRRIDLREMFKAAIENFRQYKISGSKPKFEALKIQTDGINKYCADNEKILKFLLCQRRIFEKRFVHGQRVSVCGPKLEEIAFFKEFLVNKPD
jgi:hypothetical protein